MDKKTITISESELKDIIMEVTTQVLKEHLLTEMAVGRGTYVQYGISQSATVLKHIGKILVYENDIKMSHWIEHWKAEIAAQIYDLSKIDITKDNKACKIKKKAFIQSFIEARLGKDFSEYDAKMPSYIKDGLEDEGLSKEQIKSIDVNKITADNKERIQNYLFSFVDLLTIKDLDELKEQSKVFANKL